MPEAGNPDSPPRRRETATLILLAGAGAVHACAFAPADLPWLELLALAAVLWAGLRARTAAQGLRAGWCFGAGWFGLGLHWIYISLHEYGELWAPLAALATGLLAALLALFPALALAAAARAGTAGSATRALALVASWTLAEWLREVVFGGLPWLSTGYAHVDGVLAGYAPVGGVYAVGAAAALAVLAPLWAAAQPRPTRRAAAAGAALLVAATFGSAALLRERTWSTDAGPPIRVRLVQGNIPQDVKFAEGGLDQAIERYLPRVNDRAHPVDLIVLPESAFPLPVSDLPDTVLDALADVRLRAGAALIFGAFIVEPHLRYFNSAVGMDGHAIEPQRYSKRHLVPFGEFIPYGFHWFVALMRIPIGDQERGAQFQAPMALAGQQIAVNICFEDLFGGQIIDAWHDPQRAPTLLLNLSNLAWFDDSTALPQHLQISRMRALETARPLLRATNTGVTALIDSRGQVTAALPIAQEGSLEGMVQGKSGTTPFILWGNRPIVILAALLFACCVALHRRRRPPVNSQET